MAGRETYKLYNVEVRLNLGGETRKRSRAVYNEKFLAQTKKEVFRDLFELTSGEEFDNIKNAKSVTYSLDTIVGIIIPYSDERTLFWDKGDFDGLKKYVCSGANENQTYLSFDPRRALSDYFELNFGLEGISDLDHMSDSLTVNQVEKDSIANSVQVVKRMKRRR